MVLPSPLSSCEEQWLQFLSTVFIGHWWFLQEGVGGGGSELEGLAEVEAQLNSLELSIRNQITANEKLLRDLEDYRNLIYNSEYHACVWSSCP